MTEVRLTDEQIKALSEQINSHAKCFNEAERKNLHIVSDLMDNGGADDFRNLLAMGRTIGEMKRYGRIAFVGMLISGLVFALFQGFLGCIRGDWNWKP